MANPERRLALVVDRELCEANGVCEGIAPDVFRLESDELVLLDEHPEGDRLDGAREAVRRCPRNALSLVARG